MIIVKAAAVQISPILYGREGTVDKVVKRIIELGRHRHQIRNFPETVAPCYPYFFGPDALRDGRRALQVGTSKEVPMW